MASSKPKLGQGSLTAFFRQGLKELTHYLRAFPDSGPLIEEPGQIGNAPPQAVSQQTGHSQPVRILENSIDKESTMAESPMPEQPDVNAPDIQFTADAARSAELGQEQVEFTAADSFLEQTMQEIQHMPELQEPEQEMSP